MSGTVLGDPITNDTIPGGAVRSASVSVITPTLAQPSRTRLLADVYADLSASDVSWEWVIAVDGDNPPEVPERLRTDPRVRVLTIGRRVGAAAARNLALGLAHGRYITCVDDDDRLPAGSLKSRLAAAHSSGAAWVAALLADEHDGAIEVWDSPIARGTLGPGDVWRAWACPCLPFPIGPTTLLVDAGLLRRVGGWQGLPQAEDFGMALAVTSAAPGEMLDRVVYIYHKHPGQTMRRHDFDDLEPLVRHITFERGRLLAEANRKAVPSAMPSSAVVRHHGAPLAPVTTRLTHQFGVEPGDTLWRERALADQAVDRHRRAVHTVRRQLAGHGPHEDAQGGLLQTE
ncbi:MAG TPA: glycosyltransferase family A protein [Microbacteriaceae bacterium]|nr:glycosyltransferase family A protein [Microbacteriaceae bacterium]